ncbi:hypothetical protein [Rubripirellula reticaptiva]|uniref:SLA1 homology domain-containing protein n=1 Tax=Rubripirellula reticaptiva TaxID=2528013 RepID=A0A5C6EVK8_9BACT|nr:hypothetical protein [Rubripirellula reticaptiva]TWU52047.1 hypothetical protein Poly59_36440 [Rubripirellula reticaptiva]
MNRFAITLLTLTLFSTSGFGADTFASQLRKSKHIGLSIDDALAAFTVYVYTPKQYEEHLASLDEFRRERAAFNERMAGYVRERKEARERRASTEELNAITTKRNRNSVPPYSPFDKRIKLNTVVSSGDDYIAITPLEEPNQTILIPFHRVGRVIVTADDRPSPVTLETK